MSFYTYIVQCSDGTYYTGCTNDLIKRLKQHNGAKSGAHYTKLRRPVVLKHFEKYKIQSDALKREIEIKKLKRGMKEKLWTKTSLS